ncbi:hypothetical protein MLD38_035406 [Melastoma candidum]|uniref:Uncharacterized protein n=1 Tax=Melastoma candidum TaxID=119954 RepID=A0ACB9LGI9_9MYRT|nr:hypothetical protein MLD38_035406 [Melastoma candidum]
MMTEIRHEDDGTRSADAIGKGKRTNPPSLLTLTMACTSLSSDVAGEASDLLAMTGPSSSSENTELEEDLANCLILLAQGGHETKGATVQKASVTSSDLGSNNFKCKTCFRCFPSFQALGGHRTSHKKPKVTGTEDACGRNPKPSLSHASTELSLRIAPPVTVLSNPATSSLSKPRAHECSICGAEFATGQALGGHMRRHRQVHPPRSARVTTTSGRSPRSQGSKGKNTLELDLNLPAPEDRESTAYCFQAKGQVLVFSASSALVDCPI